MFIVKDEKYTQQEHTVSKSLAKSLAKSLVDIGSSKYQDDNKFVTHPDWHSHSWLSCSEFIEVAEDLALQNKMQEYLALMAAMLALEKCGYEVRIVFWFDC